MYIEKIEVTNSQSYHAFHLIQSFEPAKDEDLHQENTRYERTQSVPKRQSD